jgi:ABC-type antimicrobial peptide transport system permease subunit
MHGANPIGHQIGDKFRFTIVGVVKDSKYTRVDEDPIPMAYLPYTQIKGVAHLEVEIRTKGNASTVLPSIERAVREVNPNLPLENPMTQQAVFEHSYSQQEMFSRLSAFFGLLAALLVAVGLYGTLAYRLARRTSEIGVRMALGARPVLVLIMLLRESIQFTLAGLLAGLVIALVSVGVMRSLLFGLQPRDPMTFVVAFVMVVLVALTASFVPARRAASIPPMQALRVE